MMKRSLATRILSIMCCFTITGCGNLLSSAKEDDAATTSKEDASSVETSKENSETSDQDKSKEESTTSEVDLSSQDAILSYIEGEWTLLDREDGEDFGTLSIKTDGSFEFTRLSDNAKGSGTISFEYRHADESEAPDGYRIDFEDVSELVPEDLQLFGDEYVDGIYHIGSMGTEDYLYLNEVGNGDTIASTYVFNTDEDSLEEFSWLRDFLFYREKNEEITASTLANDTFFAWAWKKEGDGVYLQPMTSHEYDTILDYTDRKFIGGYFSEGSDIGILKYEFISDTDMDYIHNLADWNREYPLMMFQVTTDEEGNIKKLTDVDIAMYDMYDMGELDPEFSYEGTTFIINEFEIDVTEYAPEVTAIMDCTRVGDWIIVDCHVNPHIGTYLFYNINDGLSDYFEYSIEGANLIWQGDDLSTAVYSQYGQIYDFWGNHIGSCYESEIMALSFKDETTIEAKCLVIDQNGEDKEITEEFEYEPCDKPALVYYEYLLGGPRQYRKLKELAGDAKALVIVNPVEQMLDRMPASTAFEKGALDKVAIIPLVQGAAVSIESLDSDSSDKGSVTYVSIGEAVVFDVTVSEGMPAARITVLAPGYEETIWDVVELSGRIPQRSAFIPFGEEGDGESAEADPEAIMEAYQEILYKYKEAQDGQYTMEELEEAGFYTELMQHGWPSAYSGDAVGYVFFDVDNNGIDELIITYYDYIIDIYGFDGEKVRLAYSTPYRGIAELYPDGMMRVLWSGSVSYGSTTWFTFDSNLGDYFPAYQCISEDGEDSYYDFCYFDLSDEEYQQIVDCYRRSGDYPVWVYEWGDMLTEEEFDSLVPDTDPIVLPASENLSDVVLPDDYEPVLASS